MMVNNSICGVIISALIAAAATIVTGILVQRMRNAQDNKNYLRDTFGSQLQSLAYSITVMSNHLEKALSPFDKTEIDFKITHDCFEEMMRCQSSVYSIGEKELMNAFNELFDGLDFIDGHSSDKLWSLNVRMRCNKLPFQSAKLLRKIATFQGY